MEDLNNKFYEFISDLKKGRSPVESRLFYENNYKNGFPYSITSIPESKIKEGSKGRFRDFFKAFYTIFGIRKGSESLAWVQALLFNINSLKLLYNHTGLLYGAFFVSNLEERKIYFPNITYGKESVSIPSIFPDLLKGEAPNRSKILGYYLKIFNSFSNYCSRQQNPDKFRNIAKALIVRSIRDHLSTAISEKNIEAFARSLVNKFDNDIKFDDHIKRLINFTDKLKVDDDAKMDYLIMICAILSNSLINRFFEGGESNIPWATERFLIDMQGTSSFEKELLIIFIEPGEVATVLLADILEAGPEKDLESYGFLSGNTWGPNTWEMAEWLKKISNTFSSEYREVSEFYFRDSENLWKRVGNAVSVILSEKTSKKEKDEKFKKQLLNQLVDSLGLIKNSEIAIASGQSFKARFHIQLQKIFKHRKMGDYLPPSEWKRKNRGVVRGYIFVPVSPVQQEGLYENWFVTASFNIDTSDMNLSNDQKEVFFNKIKGRFDRLSLFASILETSVMQPVVKYRMEEDVRERKKDLMGHWSAKNNTWHEELLSLADNYELDPIDRSLVKWISWWMSAESHIHSHPKPIECTEKFFPAECISQVINLFRDRIYCKQTPFNEDLGIIGSEFLCDSLVAFYKVCSINIEIDKTVDKFELCGCRKCFEIGLLELITNAASANVSEYMSDATIGSINIQLQQKPGSEGREMIMSVTNTPAVIRQELSDSYNFFMNEVLKSNDPNKTFKILSKLREAEMEKIQRILHTSSKHSRSGLSNDVMNMIFFNSGIGKISGQEQKGTTFQIIFKGDTL